MNVARAERKLTKSKEDAAVEKEVVRAMKQGTALVQASLERLEGAERSWNKHVKDAGVRINSYPTEKQVLTYMATMSRQRQRMCLAQRRQAAKGPAEGSRAQLRRGDGQQPLGDDVSGVRTPGRGGEEELLQ